LIARIKDLPLQVFRIDGAIMALGGKMPKRQRRLFGPGELVRLIGEQERAGLTTSRQIALKIMTDRKLDVEDPELIRRVRWAVTNCRKRMNARGV
jgi:hypothetical protein